MNADEQRIASSVERVVDERLTDGLTAIQEQATGLMREVAGEVWRSWALSSAYPAWNRPTRGLAPRERHTAWTSENLLLRRKTSRKLRD